MAKQALSVASDATVGHALGWSRWTVRKWRRAYGVSGSAGLSRRMGAPAVGILGHSAPEVRAVIDQMRRENPGWGAKTILTELRNAAAGSAADLPSRSAIAAYIKAQHTPRGYRRHSDLAQAPQVRGSCSHEEWELDAQGAVRIPELGSACVINLVDTFSHVITASVAVGPTRAPKVADYQLACRQAFTEFGLPQRLTLDHDSCFFESTSASPFPRQFHLWLLALGIDVRFIEHPPPQEHATIERAHYTMLQQALSGELPRSWVQLNQHLKARRTFYNQDYPSAALGDRAPLQAFPQARHSGRYYAPNLEAELLDLERVGRYLALHAWFRPVTSTGQIWIHDARYSIGQQWAAHTLTIRFDPATGDFRFATEDGQHIATHHARNLTSAYLMGDPANWLALPTYQLHLPLYRHTIREMLLVTTASGTT
jgi:hypothetical protein